MENNMGLEDRLIRVAVALLIVMLYLTHLSPGTLAMITLIVVGVLTVISMIGFCPLYHPFGINTKEKLS